MFRADGRAVPVFNDKHLSWNFSNAAEMVAISKELNFGFMAGSSLAVAWRMPPIDMPFNAQVEEVLTMSGGSSICAGCRWRRRERERERQRQCSRKCGRNWWRRQCGRLVGLQLL